MYAYRDILIREARESDAASMIALLNPIIEAGCYTALEQPYSLEEQREFVAGFPERGVFLVAECRSHGVVLGMQSIEPFPSSARAFRHLGDISTFVSLGAHGRQIGARLGAHVFELAKARGFLKILATVRADNPGAQAFYQKLGFEVLAVAKRHARIGEAFVDEVLMERFLDGEV